MRAFAPVPAQLSRICSTTYGVPPSGFWVAADRGEESRAFVEREIFSPAVVDQAGVGRRPHLSTPWVVTVRV